MPKTAIIIGAGVGGMATAIRLARQGWKVKVLEKNARVGGKLDCYSDQGFLWDMGPSQQLTSPFILRELFEYAGYDIESYLELMPIDPASRYFYPDGKVMNTWSNFHHFQIEVARREKDRGEALEKFMQYTRRVYNLLGETYLFPSPKTTPRYLALHLLKHAHHLPKIFTQKTMAQIIECYFKDPHVRQLFLSSAAAHGSSPYLAPAMLNMMAYLQTQGGGWHICGGIYHLAEALENCARDLGVEFLLGAEVIRINLREGARFRKSKVTGVTVRSGVHLDADTVICNVDATYTWKHLLSTKHQKKISQKLDRKPFSCAPLMILWGVKRRYDKLVHHNIFFSSNYSEEFKDIFQKKQPAREPTIHLCVSSRTDPTQAPPGQDNYSILVHVPPFETNHHWEQMISSYRDVILNRLEKMGLEGLRNEIVCEKIFSPIDFAAHTNAYRGTICGHAMHSLPGVLGRLSNRSKEIDKLYFVGSTTKPGGSIPFILLSAQRVASAVTADVD